MKSHYQVVVIGGGIGGCSTLYHLTQEGITDCILLERDELTSGTTWHSAAQVTNFGPNQTMLGLKTHSIKLYKELADDPDYPINYHHGTGGLRLATTQDHVDGYHHFISQAKGMGVPFEFIDAEESQKRHPLISTDGLLGSLWDPFDGDIDPAQLCQALARRARKAGATVQRFTPVTDLTETPDGQWIVHTEKGDIHCETVVNAGGYRCNEISKMMDTELPVASMEHQYMLTEPIVEIEALDFRVPLIRCPEADFYSRAEKKGLLVGFYEQDCKTWGLDGIDPNFTMALCPDDLDRVVDVMEGAFHRMPCLTETGIHSIINGPITYTPDGLPLVGKIPGKRNAFCITGLRAGLGEGGGHGWLLAQQIAHGEACYDMWCLDPRRFGSWANTEYTALKAIEDYQNEFRFHMPHEFRPAGRKVRTTPLYDRLSAQNAEFGTVNGWERVLYFKPDAAFKEVHSFKFNNAHEVIGAEIANVQSNVGIMEVSGFNRIEISGTGIHDWLDGIMCSFVSRKPNKVGLGYFLNHQGNIKGEATLANIDDNTVWFGSAAAAEHHDFEWLADLLPEDGSIKLKSLTKDYTILVVAGPKARDVMAKAAPRVDWSAEGFKWLTSKSVDIGHIRAVAMAVSFSGESAFELHIENAQLVRAYEILNEAGVEFGLKPFGLLATESMRLEKGYRHWKTDLITEFNPFESDLGRFVKMEKDFVGKSALEEMVANGPRRKFVMGVVECDFAAPHSGDSFMRDGKAIGTITSSGFGFRTGKNIAMGFIDVDYSNPGQKCRVEFLDRQFAFEVGAGFMYDPENKLVRS